MHITSALATPLIQPFGQYNQYTKCSHLNCVCITPWGLYGELKAEVKEKINKESLHSTMQVTLE